MILRTLHHFKDHNVDLHWSHSQGAVQDTFQSNTLKHLGEALCD